MSLIEKKGINAAKLAEDLGLARGSITEWKKGKAKPSTDAVIKIAEYFSVSTDWILKGREFITPQTQSIGRNENIGADSNIDSLLSDFFMSYSKPAVLYKAHPERNYPKQELSGEYKEMYGNFYNLLEEIGVKQDNFYSWLNGNFEPYRPTNKQIMSLAIYADAYGSYGKKFIEKAIQICDISREIIVYPDILLNDNGNVDNNSIRESKSSMLNLDDMRFIEKYLILSERDRGRVEGFVDKLLSGTAYEQKENPPKAGELARKADDDINKAESEKQDKDA